MDVILLGIPSLGESLYNFGIGNFSDSLFNILQHLGNSLYIFFELLKIAIFFDVILSFLSIFAGKNLSPKFLLSLTIPMYSFVKKILPTSIGPLDFAPVIVIILLNIMQIPLAHFINTL